VRKLSGAEHLYRIRVGDYRIVYAVDHAVQEVIILYARAAVHTTGCENENTGSRARRETLAMMNLSGRSLSAILSGEPDLYTAGDAGGVYRRTRY